MECIINNTKVKYEDGEIWCYIKWGRSKNFKWCLLKGSISCGYKRMSINKKRYLYHRVIYKIYNNDWDITDSSIDNCIDHIDRNPLNNNINNLRVVSNQQNQFNRECKGYYWNKNENKWQSSIKLNGEKKYLGRFKKEEDARNAYLDAKILYHII